MLNPELYTFLMHSAQINEMTPKVYSLCAVQTQPSPKSPMCIAAAVPGTVSLWICHLPPGGRVVGMLASCRHPTWQKSSVVLQAGSPSSGSCWSPPFQDLLLSSRVRMCVFYHF